MRPRNTVWMLAACLTGLAPAALAQDEVVITASRIAEPQALGATPVAVLDADELARIGAHHVAETLNRAPGVFINRGNGAEHLTAIRSPVLTGGAGRGHSFIWKTASRCARRALPMSTDCSRRSMTSRPGWKWCAGRAARPMAPTRCMA